MTRHLLKFLGVEIPWDSGRKTGTGKREQAIGEFCGGTCLEDCRAYFGDGLASACRTCPN